jgi:MFS family permease
MVWGLQAETAVAPRRFTEVLDESRWTHSHTVLFTVVSANYILDGIMFAVAPLLLYLVKPPSVAAAIFAANLVAEAVGAVSLGFLADKYGRRTLFATCLALEVAGLLILIAAYTNTIALLVGTSLMTFGIGGEFGAAYSAIAELTPARHRGKALMLATNFWNIGSAVIAALTLYYARIASSPVEQARYLLLSALGTAIVAGLARLSMPESPRWLVARGRVREAEEWVRRITGYTGPLDMSLPREAGAVSLREALSRYKFRLAVLATITIAQYATYDMAAYYLPYAPGFAFGEKAVGYVVLIANIGASIGAFLLIPLIDKSRVISTLSSFAGGVATAAALWAAHAARSAPAFYGVLLVNMIFSEWAWASLSVLQSELFPTGVRASVIGLLTSLQGIVGATVVYISILMNVSVMMASILGLWAAGLAAAVAWKVRGIESASKSVESLV